MPAFHEITAKAHALQEQLRAEGYDDDTVLASIESETDLMRVFDRVAERIDQDNRSAVIARERAKRLEARADRNLEFLDYLMRTIGNQTKLERPTATVFYQANPPRLEIDPDTRLADSLLTVVPDKPAIVKAIKAGEDLPGCRLTQSRSLRVKTLTTTTRETRDMSQDLTNPGPHDPMIMFLERVMRDPVFPIEKAQAAMQLAVEQQKRVAERAFVFDLNAMQMELTQILRDKPNPAFHSKYASLEAIDKAARPIYTKYGFSITYGTAPSSHDGWVQVTCRLAHRSGHSEVNCLEGPVSTEGARGGRIGATPIQAVGIAVSYLRRYLLQLTLNLVTASDVEDNDGNGMKDKPADTTPNYPEIVAMFEAAAGRITDSDNARKLLEWKPGVIALTALPHGEERQRYMLLRSKVQADWLANKDDGSSASEDIEGL